MNNKSDLGPRSDHIQVGLNKLREEQAKGLQTCLQNISKWNKFREDYQELKIKLESLADKIDYDIMVPFGSVAFMPGKLIHTNEIMVLLGDNWFVERSAKQASEIAGRRITQCDDTLAQFEKEHGHFEQWMLSTNKVQEELGGDLVDIVEKCDEDKEKAWREKHRHNVKEYHKNKRSNDDIYKAHSNEEEADYWARLEVNEAENKEITVQHEGVINAKEESTTSSSEEDTDSLHDDLNDLIQPQIQKNRTVRWKEEMSNSNTASTSNTSIVKLKFTETPKKEDRSHFISSDALAMPVDAPIIESPGDIYKHFSTLCEPKPLKSILKPALKSHGFTALPSTSLSASTASNTSFSNCIKQTENKAFSGVIVERESPACSVASEDGTGSRRISKFKIQRQKMKM